MLAEPCARRRALLWGTMALSVPAIALGLSRISRVDAQVRPPFICNGVPQGSPNCGPPVPRLQGFHRIDRAFGAIAYDKGKGVWFGSYQYPSKREAQDGVLDNCRQNGGSACQLMLSYTNQCAAVARAVEAGRPVVGHDSVDTGSTQDEAIAHVRHSCESDWNTKQCTVQLVNCSHHNVVKWSEWVYDD